MTAQDLGTLFAGIRLVPVVVLDDVAHAEPLGEALAAGGLPCAEVTLRTAAAAKAIEALAQRPGFLVGAGTVITIDQADEAIAAGARFVVSPGLDPAIVTHCQERSIPVLPGVATATEVQAATRLGLDAVKFFPAEAMGGAKTIKALAAPFPAMRFVPTGGVNPDNLSAYLTQRQVLAVGGSWMVAADLLRAEAWDAITDHTQRAVDLAATHHAA